MAKVYLSGPITGLTYDDARFGWRKDFAKSMAQKDGKGIEVLSPMRHEGHLAEIQGTLEKDYPNHFFSHPKMIVAKDLLDIDESTMVIANFLGAKKVSIGTVAELGYAKARGKTIVAIMEKDNIHNHPFVTELAAATVETMDDAIAVTKSLLSTGI